MYNLTILLKAKDNEQHFKHLELQLDKVTRDRDDLQSRLRTEAQQMLDTFKSVKDQLLKSEERQNVLHEKSQQLDKLNG